MTTMSIVLFAVTVMATVVVTLFAVVMLSGKNEKENLNNDNMMSSTLMNFNNSSLRAGAAC